MFYIYNVQIFMGHLKRKKGGNNPGPRTKLIWNIPISIQVSESQENLLSKFGLTDGRMIHFRKVKPVDTTENVIGILQSFEENHLGSSMF